jgi:hypothetical protein
MYCSVHHKNRSLNFLEPILGTDQYRCVEGNECQMGAGGTGGSNSNHSHNHQSHFAPVGLDNPSSNFERRNKNINNNNYNNNYNNNNNKNNQQFQQQHQQSGPLEKFMCSEHNKLRISTMMDQYFQNDGSVAYKCKVGEECKTLGAAQSSSRRTDTSSQRYTSYPPQNNRSGQQQLSPPFKPGVRPSGYQSQSFDPFPPQQQQSHWPTNHHDPYGQSYRPPYNNYPPHYYSNFSSSGNGSNNGSQQSGERQRQICAIHQKLRTIQNLVEMPSGKWECTSADPCRQSAAETSGKDQGH